MVGGHYAFFADPSSMIFRSTAVVRVLAMTACSNAGALVEEKADKGRIVGILVHLRIS